MRPAPPFNRKSKIANQKFITYPWRCLCLGFVQITRTTPLRWMILQLSHIFLTEALTFISPSTLAVNRPALPSLVAVRDAPAVQVVRRKLDQHPVARQYAYEVLAHLARDVRENLVLCVLQLDAEHRVRQSLDDFRHHFNRFFFRHTPRVSLVKNLSRLAN